MTVNKILETKFCLIMYNIKTYVYLIINYKFKLILFDYLINCGTINQPSVSVISMNVKNLNIDCFIRFA